ncbi:unnamed protein product, partial [Brenthis ino]
MDIRLALILCICFAVYVSALSLESDRSKRDVMDSVKSALTEVAKAVTDAGDSVAKAFKPTEKSIVDKMADGVKGLTE